MSWINDDLDYVIKLWNRGYSATEIAKKITGVTRSAILGKMNRMQNVGDPRITRPIGSKPHMPETLSQQKAADQRSLYILQRHEDDGASFITIGKELQCSSKSARLEYNEIIAELNRSHAR